MIILYNFVCPYCNMNNHCVVDLNEIWKREIRDCDTEEGGCGNPVAVTISVRATTEVGKIEYIQGEKK